jgi:RNA polymerase sigma-70 factor, ECF subfamily
MSGGRILVRDVRFDSMRYALIDSSVAMLAARDVTMSDEEIVERVLAGETALFEAIMRRHNQRLYRAARAILRDDSQAEDVVQDAYVRAYEHLRQFAGRASFAAWLIRIAVNEGLARLRSRKRYDEQISEDEGEGDRMDRFASSMPDPEQEASTLEVRRLLDVSIEGLPDSSRAVFVLRDVEGMSTAETADALGITEENVKVRLHRARALLRKTLYLHVSAEAKHAFVFHAVRCDRVVRNVFARIEGRVPQG